MSLRLFLKSSRNPLFINWSKQELHTTCLKSIDQKWRRDKKLNENPNSWGPLTNLPDYSFVDGRPTPLGANQLRRTQEQRQMAEKMVTLCEELNYAKERYQRIKNQKAEREQKIIDSKLKPKGHLLLKK